MLSVDLTPECHFTARQAWTRKMLRTCCCGTMKQLNKPLQCRVEVCPCSVPLQQCHDGWNGVTNGTATNAPRHPKSYCMHKLAISASVQSLSALSWASPQASTSISVSAICYLQSQICSLAELQLQVSEALAASAPVAASTPLGLIKTPVWLQLINSLQQ